MAPPEVLHGPWSLSTAQRAIAKAQQVRLILLDDTIVGGVRKRALRLSMIGMLARRACSNVSRETNRSGAMTLIAFIGNTSACISGGTTQLVANSQTRLRISAKMLRYLHDRPRRRPIAHKPYIEIEPPHQF